MKIIKLLYMAMSRDGAVTNTILSGCRRLQRENSIGRALSNSDNRTGRVASEHAREDGGVNNEEVISAINFGVQVHHGFATFASIICADCAGACPVVRASLTWGGGDLRDC